MLGAYSTFSWLLYRSNLTWQSWLIVLVLALVQAFLLTTLSRGLQLLVGSWLKSDLGYFSVVLIGGLLAVFALAWLQIFGHITVLIASEVLARIDLRRAGYSGIQALVILVTISLLGLAVGGTAYYYHSHVVPEPTSIKYSLPGSSSE
jgi:hypothetical protein